MFTAPPTVNPPATVVLPIAKVLAVTAAMSDVVTLNVPPAEPTEIDFAPFGIRLTVPEPALTVPEKVTSLAVMVIIWLPVDEIEVETALVTLPVPSVVMSTLTTLVALALRIMLPFDPEDVCNATPVDPERVLDAVIVPLPVRVRIPPAVTTPVVPIVADAPVVVMERLPPTMDVSMIVAPALVT